MTDTRKGACLCGAVTFEADLEAKHYHACHCAMCRKWGGPAMATTATALRLADGAPLKAFGSSDYGERVFCAECGTHLFWRMKDGSADMVWVGALQDSDDLKFELQIFTDSKPSHYDFANETTMLTGEQFIAMVSGES